MKLHPYALILGIGIAVMVLFALRHPLFAIFAGLLSTFGLDMYFKSKITDDKK
ncbi:hypothetical protein ACJ3XI_10195 [Litorimonas sp. RW-G-Af-16]|uniref:hypothetical protein n=1 Tax=Litorimonas sp. RW-G-Af-16 TaxID=3241168 RepID=UPI00390CA4EB